MDIFLFTILSSATADKFYHLLFNSIASENNQLINESTQNFELWNFGTLKLETLN